MPDPLVLYTAAEVADLLRMNHQVVQRKLQSGEIPGYRIGKEWRVERSQLLSWLEERSNQRDHQTARYFGRDGRITVIPKAKARRDAILVRLAADLEPDRAYREADLNAVLRRYHDDVAFLRREMVGIGLLVRTTRGVYKRKQP